MHSLFALLKLKSKSKCFGGLDFFCTFVGKKGMEEKVTDMHLWDLQREIVRLRSELDSHPTVDSDWYKAFLTFVDDVKTAFSKIEDVRDLNWFEFLLVKDICCEVDYLFDENDCTHEIDEVFEELDECQEILVEKGPTLDEFIDRIMDELREYTLKERNSYYDVLVREIRCIRNNRSEELTPDVWGEKLRELEDFLLSEEVDEGDDKEVNQMLVKMSKADRLCCPKLKKEYKIDIYRTIKSNNVLSFFEYALYINILLSETFPDTLKPQFEAWLKGEAYKNPEPEPAQEEETKHEPEDELVEKIKGCFWCDGDRKAEDLAREFLTKIKDKEAKYITDLVRDWKKRKWISENNCRTNLWKPLHDAGIYPRSIQNWNDQIKK